MSIHVRIAEHQKMMLTLINSLNFITFHSFWKLMRLYTEKPENSITKIQLHLICITFNKFRVIQRYSVSIRCFYDSHSIGHFCDHTKTPQSSTQSSPSVSVFQTGLINTPSLFLKTDGKIKH